jgi:hypothetical protein
MSAFPEPKPRVPSVELEVVVVNDRGHNELRELSLVARALLTDATDLDFAVAELELEGHIAGRRAVFAASLRPHDEVAQLIDSNAEILDLLERETGPAPGVRGREARQTQELRLCRDRETDGRAAGHHPMFARHGAGMALRGFGLAALTRAALSSLAPMGRNLRVGVELLGRLSSLASLSVQGLRFR